MLASGGPAVKSLVRVAGLSLLERNVWSLLRAGLRDVRVATGPPGEGSARLAAAEPRLQAVCRAHGASLSLLPERVPLGNIGAAGLLGDLGQPLLVVYGDNLTDLDLRSVLITHEREGAAMTLAVHDEALAVPYGRLAVDETGRRVLSYEEKPDVRVTVCSAVTALSAEALQGLPSHRPTGLVDLYRTLSTAGVVIAAHRHDSHWVDVNDLASVARAEAVLRACPDGFELGPTPQTQLDVVLHVWSGLVALNEGGMLPEGRGELWGAVSFDDVDPVTSAVARFTVHPGAGSPTPPPGTNWAALERPLPVPVSRALSRLALPGHAQALHPGH